MLSFFSDKYFLSSILISFISLALFFFNKKTLSLIFLFLGSLVLGIFISSLDPFLNLWDEQYHALVAKHLMSNPFKPILIEQPLIITNDWVNANIWLHKQPLFLWQMAFSIKLFGLNEFGVRFPSVLMHSLLIFFIYDVGKIIHSKKVGYFSALFFTFSYFCLEYLTGFYPTDHNDVAFLFYTFLSIWALLKYFDTSIKWYIILIGVFSGLAILNKWLTGLLVYGVWVVLIIYMHKSKFNKKEFLNFATSLIICCIVFLPWQFYCIANFPKEYASSMDFNLKHISLPLEGHGGDYLFYYNAFFEQFGEGFIIPFLIILSFVFMLYKFKNVTHKLILITPVFILYLFFTIVKTKMYGYVIVAIPFFILSIGYCFNLLMDIIQVRFKNKTLNYLVKTISVLLLVFILVNASKLYKHHSNKEYGRYLSRLKEMNEKNFYLKVKADYKNEKCAIFNLNFTLNGYITGIFYTGYACYDFIPNTKQIDALKALGYKIIIINDNLPEFIINDISINKIKA